MSVTLLSGNSIFELAGSDLSATTTELLFDFSSYGYAAFVHDNVGYAGNWWCLEGPSSSCTPFGNSSEGTESVQVGDYYGGGPYGVAHYDTPQVVGATGTIPEPSTWAMMLVGFAGLGYAGYRRRTAGLA